MSRFSRALPFIGGAAASAAVAMLYRRYQRETRAHQARLVSGSRIAQTACGPVEYAFTGSGPLVLVSHGGGGGYDQGLLAARILDNHFRILAPSRFGYLGTPSPADCSARAQAGALAALLDTLGIERVLVMGMSAGGVVAVQFALRYPERCSALLLSAAMIEPPARLSPAVRWFTGLMLSADFLFWGLVRFFPGAVLASAGTPPGAIARLSPAERVLVHDLLDTILPMSQRREGLLNDMAMADGERYPLENVCVPTLLYHSRDDALAPFAGAQDAARRIPNARLIALPDGGHFGLAADKKPLEEVVRFLQEHAAGAAC